MAVHNHGPEDGEGLNCNELRLPDGSLRGACLITGEELAAVHRAKLPSEEEKRAREILFTFLASIPAVRVRASSYARSGGTDVDLHILASAARDMGVFAESHLLELVKTTIAKTTNPLTAEEAWAEHSVGFVWDSEKERYGEYRAYLAGYQASRTS